MYGLNVADLAWSAFIPIVIVLLHKHDEYRRNIRLIVVGAYIVGWGVYQLVRLLNTPSLADHWLPLGLKGVFVSGFVCLTWHKLFPSENEEEVHLVERVAYLLVALLAILSYVLSFIA